MNRDEHSELCRRRERQIDSRAAFDVEPAAGESSARRYALAEHANATRLMGIGDPSRSTAASRAAAT